ncbi:glucoamylase family protein [Streptomyces sp. NPDC051840]|uniref:glucoamylase family protein n=1 Tax=Streptomyces sp. NPDC051840 TaxID=3154752 RepID=UPI0034338F17
MRRRTFLAATAGTSAVLTLGAPAVTAAARGLDTRSQLLRWFSDTYRSLEAMVADSGLPADNIDLSGGSPVLSENTSTTNIGCWMWSTVAAAGLGVITEAEMQRRLARTITTVEKMERLHGFWVNWYNTFTGEVLHEWPGSGSKVSPLLSTVDNAWLDTGLRIAEYAAAPALAARIRRLRAGIDWSFLYEPYDAADPVAHPGHMHTGFKVEENTLTPYYYGTLISETRMAGYLGITDGSVPREHYWHMLRTFTPEEKQEMPPQGTWVTRDGVRYFNGHYTYRGRNVVPGWGGDMFGQLMPELFVPSARLSSSWRTTLTNHVLGQRDHGLIDAEYGYWGFSPCNVPEGGYQEYGVQFLGINPGGYCSNTDRTYVPYGEPMPAPSAYTNGVVTPHAGAMALMIRPVEAMENLRRLARDFQVYEDGMGFYDSVNVSTGKVSTRMLSLDQGMAAAAFAQVLQPGLLQRPFLHGAGARRLNTMLAKEDFGL